MGILPIPGMGSITGGFWINQARASYALVRGVSEIRPFFPRRSHSDGRNPESENVMAKEANFHAYGAPGY